MPHPSINSLASLFQETAETHHHAFATTDGVDPEWPSWYAEHLQQNLNEALGATLTKSELVYLVIAAETERAQRAPGAQWPRYYAKFLLERYS